MESSKKKWIAIIVAVVFLAGGASAWAIQHFRTTTPPPDPQVTKVAGLGGQMFVDVKDDLSEDKLRDTALKLVEEMAQMTPEQKKQAGKQFQATMQKFIAKHIDDYFNLPTHEQQVAQLDADIDRMERLISVFGPIAKMAMANRKNSDGAPAGGGDGSGPRGGGGPFGQPKLSAEERDKHRREMLDTSTPQQRAQFAEYSRQLMQRRQERGLPMPGQRKQ
ncbi:MAG: hypothetical protein K2R98_11080 [Gemmataceae bacterium]|nr:hypothetical protein [Gemmataceae bacterium]